MDCKTCIYDHDGHCILGNDNWKLTRKDDEECEEFKPKSDICKGCGTPISKCEPLWKEQKKCCPDCSH